MKKIIFLIFWMLLLSCGWPQSHAQDQRSLSYHKAPSPADKNPKPENSLLWEISGKGLKQKSYLYGTMHVLCPSDLVITDKVKQALQSSNTLVMELDLSEPTTMAEVQSNFVMTDGKTARDYLSPSDYEIVEEYFQDSLNMSLDDLSRLKPFVLSMFPMFRSIDCKPVSVETALIDLAKEKNLKVAGLETVQQQMDLFDKAPLQKQGQMLVESIRDQEKSKKMFAEMVSLYKQENITALHAMTSKYMSEDYAEYEQSMLNERNHNWIRAISEDIKKQPCFYAVGAAHLGGEQGVISLLKKQGYTVKAVR